MTIAPIKQELREQMRARLAAQSAADVRKKSADIWERLSVLGEFTAASRSLIYISKATEVDTRGLIQQLLAMGRQVYVPWFDDRKKQYVASELARLRARLEDWTIWNSGTQTRGGKASRRRSD